MNVLMGTASQLGLEPIDGCSLPATQGLDLLDTSEHSACIL